LWGKTWESASLNVKYTLDEVEISTVNKLKIDNKAFSMYPTTLKLKTLQSLTHSFKKLFKRINLLNIMPTNFGRCLMMICF